MLIGAVVIHLPYLFIVGATLLDVVDLGLCDAVDAPAKAEDDLVGEAMRDLTR